MFFPPYPDHPDLLQYDEDGLLYLTPSALAGRITTWTLKLMAISYGTNRDSVMIDATAGLGGHTLSMAMNSQVSRVLAFELDKNRFKVNYQSFQLFLFSYLLLIQFDYAVVVK